MKHSKGFTKVLDDYIDYYLPLLSGSEFKLLILIVRTTVGWNKDKDILCYNQIIKRTGLSRRIITPSIEKLYQLKLIQITDESGKQLNTAQQRIQSKCNYYTLIAAKDAKSTFKGMHKLHPTIYSNKQQKTSKIKLTDRERIDQILDKHKE